MVANLQTSVQGSPDREIPESRIAANLSFFVIIKKISNVTDLDIETVVLKIPICEQNMDKFVRRKLLKHVQAQVNLMRNIRIEFTILIGSALA